MFFCKNIGIWYLFFSLVRTTKLSSSLEESKVIPYRQDETKYFPDHSQNTDDYPNREECVNFKHAEESIQEYEGNRDERDSQNLNGGRIGLFSWWWRKHPNTRIKSMSKTTSPPIGRTTLDPPLLEITYPPATGTTCPLNTEIICTSETENTCTEDTEITCTPDTENTCTPDTENTCIQDPEIICISENENTCTEDTEITCTPDIENNFPPDTGTSCPDTDTLCSPDTETTILACRETIDTIDWATIGSTTIVPNKINSITNGFYTISSSVNGSGTMISTSNSLYTLGSTTYDSDSIGSSKSDPTINGSNTIDYTTKVSTTNGQDTTSPLTTLLYSSSTTNIQAIIDSTKNVPSTIGSTVNGYGTSYSATNGSLSTIGSTTSGPVTIGSTSGPVTIGSTSGPVTISSTSGPVTISSTTSGLGIISSSANVSGTIGTPTIGQARTGSATMGQVTVSTSTSTPITIDSKTTGLGTISSSANTISQVTIGSSTNSIQNHISSTADPDSHDSTTIDPDSHDSTTINPDSAESTTVDAGSVNTAAITDDITEESVEIRITVDPAAISTDPDTSDTDIDVGVSTSSQSSSSSTPLNDTSTTPSSTAAYITACYTVTMDCSPITIGTPVICDSDIIYGTESTTSSTTVTTTTGSTTSTAVTTDTGGDGDEDTVTTPITPPPALKMFGAGMFVPIYQIPMTPFVVTAVSLVSPTITHNYVQLNDDSSLTKLQQMKKPIYVDNKFKNVVGMNNNVMVGEKPIGDINVLNPIKDKFIPLPITKNLSERKFRTDNTIIAKQIYSKSNFIGNKQKGIINNPLMQDTLISQFEKKEILEKSPKRTLIDPLKKITDYNQKTFNEKSIILNNKTENVLNRNRILQFLREPEKKNQNTLHLHENFNPLYSHPDQLSKTVSYVLTENYAALKIGNQAVSGMKNFNSEFVKYNDTYLSENSNTSVNLVDLCKNVTCKGNNYLSQCCSRVFGTGKCEGEDFSYLHPIPGDTTTVTTTVRGSNRSAAANTSQPTTMPNNYTSNCQCGTKQKNSRVARENDMNDFIKFQLMHGLTNPDGKEMMNALKAASLEVQKVNSDFHNIDPSNVLQMNGNGQESNYHRLFKKEPGPVPLFSSNKVLDDLRATVPNSYIQSNLKPFPLHTYRFIRNQGLQDQIDYFKENNMIIEKLKKETEIELKRLSLLENKRREEELLYDKERENDLKELKIIQDLIDRELQSRTQGDTPKRAISDTVKKLVQQPSKTESTYTKLVKTIENSGRNDDLDNLFLNRYSSMGGNASNSVVSVERFPELEIKSSASNSHDDALFVLNLASNKEIPSDEYRKRRDGYNGSQNKILLEKI